MDASPEMEAFGRRQEKIGLNAFSFLILAVVAGGVAITARHLALPIEHFAGLAALGVVLGLFFGLAPRVAYQWERAVVLRLGKFHAMKGPGLFFVIPLVDRVAMWVDCRVRTTGFAAEKTLTEDTVPVNVDAVLFWAVKDAEKAALAVEDYREAVAWAAQTALRDVIGRTDLARMLVGRESIDTEIQKLIDARTHDWGISVNSVEIRDVVIPPALEDAMSRQAQAEREKQARIILGDAEVAISEKFALASERYLENSVAYQLRSINLLYEGMKEKTTLMIVPSGMVDGMGAAACAGLASLAKPGEKKGNGH